MFSGIKTYFIECDDASVELKLPKYPSALKAQKTNISITINLG